MALMLHTFTETTFSSIYGYCLHVPALFCYNYLSTFNKYKKFVEEMKKEDGILTRNFLRKIYAFGFENSKNFSLQRLREYCCIDVLPLPLIPSLTTVSPSTSSPGRI